MKRSTAFLIVRWLVAVVSVGLAITGLGTADRATGATKVTEPRALVSSASALSSACEPLSNWPDGYKITFVSYRDGRPQIYLMNPNGTDQVRLCTLHSAVSPHWSPDATRLLFMSKGHVCLMYADGSYQQDLGPGRHPDWSPDGTKIVFSMPFDVGIATMRLDGTGVSQLTDSQGGNHKVPRWNPDGTKIAFNGPPPPGPDGNDEIYVMNADGSNVVNITNSEFGDINPVWSPDGTKIAFQYITDAWVMNADGSNRVDIGGEGDQSWLAWSPDGSELAFTMRACPTYACPDNNDDIWIMDADGSNRVKLTDHLAGDAQPAWSWRPIPSSPPPPPTISLTPTTTGRITINEGALSTSYITVSLVLAASNPIGSVDQMSFSNDGTSWSAWLEYSTSPHLWPLLTGDGSKTVYGAFRDAVGNTLTVVSDTIDLDTGVRPEYGFTINDGALFINQTAVTLTIGAQPNTAQMQISNDGGFFGAQWEPYVSHKLWHITQYGSYVIPRVVYVRYRNHVDGSPSSTYQDDIILDMMPPTGSVEAVLKTSESSLPQTALEAVPLAINDYTHIVYLPLTMHALGAPANVVLYLSAQDDVSGVAHMMISNRADFSSAVWEAYATRKEWNVPEGATTTVYVKFRDHARNVSEVVTDSVTMP